ESGREQLFDLEKDSREKKDLSQFKIWEDELACWRDKLIDILKDRPEGFTDGEKLIPVKDYDAFLD
ncbi:MAG: arylsulfatase, partial [bacterium]